MRTFALLADTVNPLEVLRVPLRSVRGKVRITGDGRMSVTGGWGDRQNTANRLDPKLTTVIISEPLPADAGSIAL